MKPGRIIGIPLEEVGLRLKELRNAITEKGMAIGAETNCNLEITSFGKIARSATITVYFFQKEEDQTTENLENSKAVKNPEE